MPLLSGGPFTLSERQPRTFTIVVFYCGKHFAQTQAAPFTRPPMAQLLDDLTFALDKNYPARGDLALAA